MPRFVRERQLLKWVNRAVGRGESHRYECNFSVVTMFNSNISKWDVSRVRDMSHVFAYATQFNYDISKWDMSSVTTMSSMLKLTNDSGLFDLERVWSSLTQVLYLRMPCFWLCLNQKPKTSTETMLQVRSHAYENPDGRVQAGRKPKLCFVLPLVCLDRAPHLTARNNCSMTRGVRIRGSRYVRMKRSWSRICESASFRACSRIIAFVFVCNFVRGV